MTEDKKDDHILHYFGGGGGGGNKACGAEINIRQKKKSLLIHWKIWKTKWSRLVRKYSISYVKRPLKTKILMTNGSLMKL